MVSQNQRQRFLDVRIAHVLTPEGLSMIYNWLDVYFHGLMKHHIHNDRARDSLQKEMIEYFRTTTGTCTAGSVYVLMKNLKERFTKSYNTDTYRDGFQKAWFKVGYGLNPVEEDENDRLFLAHAFGYNIGMDPIDTLQSGDFDWLSADTETVLDRNKKPGRKHKV